MGVVLDIEALVLPEGLVLHPEGFREALSSHLSRLLAKRGLEGLKPGPDGTLRLESATLSLPPGLDTERAAAHAAAKLLAQLTGDTP
ncbi:hypothetical protein D7Y27_37975 [Corallococcus sp. AB004]|nr:hypothetical protein D7Y27_37975 [Corallococcus sp. AB004]